MYYIVAIILLIVLFFPIKLRITVSYRDGKLQIFIYNKELKLKKKVAKHKASAENLNKADFKLINFFPDKIKKILYKLSRGKHKIGAEVEFEINYGFEDAALTGICYGLLHGLSTAIYTQFCSLVKIKKYNFVVLPHFNEPMLNFRANCIISFNLAKIIYMLFLIYIF